MLSTNLESALKPLRNATALNPAYQLPDTPRASAIVYYTACSTCRTDYRRRSVSAVCPSCRKIAKKSVVFNESSRAKRSKNLVSGKDHIRCEENFVGNSGTEVSLGNMINFVTTYPPRKLSELLIDHLVTKSPRLSALSLSDLKSFNRFSTYIFRSAARELLADVPPCSWAVGKCGRVVLGEKEGNAGVMAIYVPKRKRSFFKGLMACGSYWHCSYCREKIAQHRCEELKQLVEPLAQGQVVMVTYTLRHRLGESLQSVRSTLVKAIQRSKAGNQFALWCDRVGYLGEVKAFEVTFGKNGWHPHCHELFILKKPISKGEVKKEFNGWLRRRYMKFLNKFGGSGTENAFDVSFGYANASILGDYLTKTGDDLTISPASWTAVEEMSLTHYKESRVNFTPSALLAAWFFDAEATAGSLWAEYARVMHGTAFQKWSPGLRQWKEVDDQTIADADPSDQSIDLAFLSRRQWRQILDDGLFYDLMRKMDSGDPAIVSSYLIEVGVWNSSN